MFWCASRLFVCHLCIWHTSASRKRFPALALPKRRLSEHQYWHANPVARVVCLLSLSVSFSLFFSVSWEVWKVRSAVLERVKVCITPHSCVFFPPLSQSLTGFLLFPLTEHKEVPEWRKAVPSYTQSNSSMDFRNWNTLPRDESQESLPKNWEMAYTETGMVYFIE